MEDDRIIDLYFERAERAITETAKKYGGYCFKISHNILNSKEDSEECVNETYLRAWKTIPPQKPRILSAFLARIVRNLSINTYNSRKASKRGGGSIPILLHELEECLPHRDTVESIVESNLNREEIGRVLSNFLHNLKDDERRVFIRRYFYADSIKDICKAFDMSESKVKSLLFRNRKRLKSHLTKEGIDI